MKETKFKDTEVGWIPEDWQLDRLKENFEFKANNTLSRDALSESGVIQDVHYGDVLIKYGSHLDVHKDSIPYISDSGFKASSFISDGDVIIADTAEDETVGKATEVINVGSNKLVSGLHTMWLHPIKQEKYALGYLGYAFNASIYHNQLLPLMQGTKVTSISKSAIKDTYIVHPSKSEQSRIATTFSAIDNLISKLGKLIEKKRAIKQGAMQQLLTGKERLKGFNEPWVEYEIRNICEVKRGVRVVKNQLNTEGKFPVFQNTNMPLGYFGNYNVNECTPFVIIGGSAGQIGICYTKYWAADDCAYFECSNMILKEFLYLILLHNQKMILQNVRTGTVPRLDRSVLQKLRIRIPSNIQEQYAITNICSNMEKEVTHLEVKKAKYESIKQGMMQQLLTGKIRLK